MYGLIEEMGNRGKNRGNKEGEKKLILKGGKGKDGEREK